jgi:uncharacterized protein YjbI with pentapeptide repeats
MPIQLRMVICLVFCLAFYSCSSFSNSKAGADKIQSSLSKGDDIYYDDVIITESLNLIDTNAAVQTTPVLKAVYIHSAIVFKNCTFKGAIMGSLKGSNQASYSATFLKNLYFDNCVFEEDVNLEGATINGYCNFLNCTFKKAGLFNRTTFSSTVSFSKSTFMETGGFQQCTFMGSTFFNEAHFYDACFFQNSYFYRDFTFSLAACKGYTDFNQANFYSNMFCNYAHFSKGLSFNDSNFRGRTEFVGSEFMKAEFDGSTFYVRSFFDKSTFSENLSLKDCRFISRKPETTSYSAGKLDISGVEVSGAKMVEF